MDTPQPDPSAIVTLLQGLPRVKITPETITQHTIDKWYEREREYRAEIERLRSRAQTAEERLDGQAWDDLRAKWEILAERTLVASALLSEAEPDLEAELAPRRLELLRKVLAGEAGRDDLLSVLVPQLAEAERQRASTTEAAIDRVWALGAGLADIDPAELYGDTERAEILASAGRAILAVLAETNDQAKDTP